MKRPSQRGSKPAGKRLPLDRYLADAIEMLLEAIAADDRGRALRVVEALAAVIALAPRRVPRRRR